MILFRVPTIMNSKIIARNKRHLQYVIDREISLNGNDCDLNHIDISNITDMSSLFSCSEFVGDISNWNVSHVKDMKSMFFMSKFNGDISKWDVSNVESMDSMFYARSKFNSDISGWDVSKVKTMDLMFKDSKFTQDLSDWKPYSLISFVDMFDSNVGNIPYWAEIEDKELRNKTISSYSLEKQLEKELITNNGDNKKKPKI